MPVSQYSSVQTAAGGEFAAQITSPLGLNFSGQIIPGQGGAMAQPSIFSVGGWFRLMAVGAQGSIFAVGSQFALTVGGDGTLSVGFAGGSSLVSDIAITDTGWHFVTCSFLQDGEDATSGVLNLFLDGSATATGIVTGSSSSTAGAVTLGGGAGTVDLVSWCVWSTPLSSTDMDVPFWGDPTGGANSEGLVVAFDFAGGSAVDVSPTGTGTVTVSQLTWHTPCLQLSGGSVTPGDDNLMPGSNSPYSVLVWVDIPTEGTQPVLTSGSGQTPLTMAVSPTMAWIENAGTAAPTVTPGWHHLAATFDGTTFTAYVDGVEVAAGETGPSPLSVQSFVIGADPQGNQAQNLALQSLSVWTTCLAPADIVDYMTGALPFGVEGCVGFFPLTDASEAGMGNAITFTAATSSGTAVIGELDTVIPVSDGMPEASFASELLASLSAGSAGLASGDGSPGVVRFSDLRTLAEGLTEEALPDLDDPMITGAQEWYESLLDTLPQPLADRLRAEFTENLRKGMALADSGSKTGRFEVRVEDGQTIAVYHGADGPEEVGRIEGTLSPYLIWVATIFLDIAGIIAAMFGILTSAAKVTGAVGLFDNLFPKIGAAAANVPAGATATQRATTAIFNVLKVLWEWKAIGTLIWNIIMASWWSIAFTVAAIVAQIVACVVSGGWLIAVKVAQMAIAIGNLVKDLLLMPSTTDDEAPPAPA